MQSDFKIGDVVQLNSGSPYMTVSARGVTSNGTKTSVKPY